MKSRSCNHRILAISLNPGAKLRYTAVIGDLVESKKLGGDARASLQSRLQHYFSSLPAGPGTGIVARPMITLGDEFQGLFSSCSDPGGVLAFLTGVQELLRPTRVRFGIGIGALSTALRETAIGMDGPCFHRAREAITASRKKEWFCTVRGGSPLTADMLTLILSEMLHTRNEWSDEQREAIHAYLAMPGDERSWSGVAERLDRSPSAITQRQQAARWAVVRRMEEVSRRALGQMEAQAEGDDG